MKHIRFWVFNFIVSLVLGVIVAIPELRLPRSVPGSHCYARIYQLSSAIKSFNEMEIIDGSNKPLISIFTEAPESLERLNSIRPDLYNYFKARVKCSDCNYGTIGDLIDDGVIVCLTHGSATETPNIKDLKATFYSKNRGIFKQSGIAGRRQFYADLATKMRFAAAYNFTFVFLSVSVTLFIIYGLSLQFFWKNLQ